MSRAVKAGCIAAVVHLVFVAAVAAGAAHTNGSWGGPESWLFAAMADFPVYWLCIRVFSAVLSWSNEFLSLLVLFGIAGTAQWFLIFYTLSRLYSLLRASKANI
jgi:hypothetical protein